MNTPNRARIFELTLHEVYNFGGTEQALSVLKQSLVELDAANKLLLDAIK